MSSKYYTSEYYYQRAFRDLYECEEYLDRIKFALYTENLSIDEMWSLVNGLCYSLTRLFNGSAFNIDIDANVDWEFDNENRD